MADEILILEGDGGFHYDLLLIFPIASPAQIGIPPANVVPTPTSVDGVSVLSATAAASLSQAERDAFDAGTSAFRVVSFPKNPNFNNPQLLVAVRAEYAAQLARFTRWYDQTYLHSGARFDAV